jgi:hypothetical protein
VRHDTERHDLDAVLTLIERVAQIARDYPEVPPIRLTLGGELRLNVAADGVATLDHPSPTELVAAPDERNDVVDADDDP